MPHKNLFDIILERAKKKRRKIAIGIYHTDEAILASLKRAQEFVDVIIYGINIPGFSCVEFTDQAEAGRRLVADLKNGVIDQFVRGQVDDLYTVDEFKKLYNVDPKERRVDFGLLEDADGWQFFLGSASNPDLQTLDEKIRVIDVLTKWLCAEFLIKPKVAVMATCRPGSYGKDPVMSQTYDEAEAVVKHLTAQGIEAKNVHIEIEKAKEWGANIVLPARGTIGNQIFRAILYLGHGKNLVCPTLFPGKGMYEDCSRNEKDWFSHLMFAQSLANRSLEK